MRCFTNARPIGQLKLFFFLIVNNRLFGLNRRGWSVTATFVVKDVWMKYLWKLLLEWKESYLLFQLACVALRNNSIGNACYAGYILSLLYVWLDCLLLQVWRIQRLWFQSWWMAERNWTFYPGRMEKYQRVGNWQSENRGRKIDVCGWQISTCRQHNQLHGR